MSVYKGRMSPEGELREILKIDARQLLVLEYSHRPPAKETNLELEEIELCCIPSCVTQNLHCAAISGLL